MPSDLEEFEKLEQGAGPDKKVLFALGLLLCRETKIEVSTRLAVRSFLLQVRLAQDNM